MAVPVCLPDLLQSSVRPGTHPPTFPPDAISEEVLRNWEPDILRAAAFSAKSYGLRSVEASDLAQEARIRILRALARKPDLPTAFVRTVIKNAVRKLAGSETRAAGGRASGDSADIDNSAGDSAHDDGQSVLTVAVVKRWVQGLPVRLGRVFDLIYIQGLTQREAARVLSVSQPRVSALLAMLLERGRVELRGVVN